MSIITLIIFFFIIPTSALIYIDIRINWIRKKRTEVMAKSIDRYLKLQNFHTMFFKFWIWDINKFY